MSKVIVIGGGAAGMMAAIRAAENGHQVTLLEQNEKLGKKLYITGKGRCNITNDCETEHLLKNVIRNSRFLYSAFYCFDSQRVMAFFESHGLTIKTERGGRVFPQSDHSSDVIRTLQKTLQQEQVKVQLHAKVADILTVGSDVLQTERFSARKTLYLPQAAVPMCLPALPGTVMVLQKGWGIQ